MNCNTLHLGDCLQIMQEVIPEESVDLIYLDPPFYTNKDYYLGKGKDKVLAFTDIWDEVDKGELNSLPENVIVFLRVLDIPIELLSYLTFMSARLLACRKVLAKTGCIFLHCDPKASHYLKLIMDMVFPGGFTNEIIWHYGLGGFRVKSRFPSKHDTLLYYRKSKSFTFNLLRGEITPAMDSVYRFKDEHGRRYRNAAGKRHYLKGGKPYDSVWEIPSIPPIAHERTGYPTQKPLPLLERIILATTLNEVNIVLDPFCGSGTTLLAAARTNRKWIGIDRQPIAYELCMQRLTDAGVEYACA